jgi:hypothetical protein
MPLTQVANAHVKTVSDGTKFANEVIPDHASGDSELKDAKASSVYQREVADEGEPADVNEPADEAEPADVNEPADYEQLDEPKDCDTCTSELHEQGIEVQKKLLKTYLIVFNKKKTKNCF